MLFIPLIKRFFKVNFVVAFSMLFLFCTNAKAQDDYDKARDRFLVQLTGGSDIDLNDPQVVKLVNKIAQKAMSVDKKINRDGNSEGVFTDVTSFSESNLLATYGRLKDMALAYATPGSSLHNNPSLKNDILTGMDKVVLYWFNTRRPKPRTPAFPTTGANWFTWNIAAPLVLNDCMVLMYPALSKQQIDSYCAVIDYFDPNIAEYTGANLSWVAGAILIRGIITKDPAKVANGILGIKKALAYVKIPIEGFYRDGSQTAHKSVSYNGGYGPAQFHNVTSVEDMLSVTDSLKITGPDANNVYKWAFDSFMPLIYRGAMMPMVMGRYAGRTTSHGEGQGAAGNILFLSQSAPTSNTGFGTNFRGEAYPENPQLAMWKRLKYWYAVDLVDSHEPENLFQYKLYKDFLKKNIAPAAEPTGNFRFAVMDRVVHLRPGFGFGISMFSNRIKNYEPLNEFLKGWHTGDGMTYLFNSDLLQYDDNFWPTVDSYRLPGTTVAFNTKEEPGKFSDQDWVGGSDLDGYGATGMSLHVGDLVARKSWFMFDDEVVALGAGITATGGDEIETIVENRKLTSAGDNQFTVNGTQQPTSFKKGKLTAIKWAHLAGNVAGADIGYCFYKPVDLNYIRENRSGSWHEVSSGRSADKVSNNYLTLWYNHGVQPVDSTYAYALLPGRSAQQVNAYSTSPATVILANTKDIQAVKNVKLNIIAANFWIATPQSVDVISCSSKASVMVRQIDGQVQVSVSDPTMANTGQITLELKMSATGVISADPGVHVQQTGSVIKLSVDVKDAVGKTFRAVLAAKTQ